MKKKLFPNIERLLLIFAIVIAVITVSILLLRLVVLKPAADITASKNTTKTSSAGSTGESSGSDLVFDYTLKDELVFKDFNTTINPFIENPAKNNAYMQVKIISDQNLRAIYETSYIREGVKESTMTLSGDPLPAGTYECTAVISAIDPDTKTVIEEFKQPITIVIENDVESSGDTSSDESV